jgi:hypothetical protein
LLQVALLAYAAGALPHLVYHLTTVEEYSTSDNVLSLAGLAAAAFVPLALLPLTREKEDAWRASTQ